MKAAVLAIVALAIITPTMTPAFWSISLTILLLLVPGQQKKGPLTVSWTQKSPDLTRGVFQSHIYI